MREVWHAMSVNVEKEVEDQEGEEEEKDASCCCVQASTRNGQICDQEIATFKVQCVAVEEIAAILKEKKRDQFL